MGRKRTIRKGKRRMLRRTVSGIMLTMLSIGILTLAFNVPLAEPRVNYDGSAVFASNSSEIEIYYDNNASNPGGLGGSLPGGLAVNFTPPSEEYWVLKRVKFYGMRWANESYDNMPFYVEVWDRNRNELLHVAYKYSDYFKNYDSKWVTVDIPDVLVKDDFFVCIFPNMIYMSSEPSPHMNVGFNNDPPISNRSYRVRMDDNSIEWQIPGNLFIRAIVSEPIITVPDDFPTIQEAINAANKGATIYVRAGTYYENVVVNKSISLIGENKVTTTIDGHMTATVVAVTADNVTISEFTIRNGGGRYAGISLSSNRNNVTNNILWNNWCGINLERYTSYNLIANNSITNNLNGVHGELWYDSTIVGNDIMDNLLGIWVGNSMRNTIVSNNIRNHLDAGISMCRSSHNTIVGNNITDNNQCGDFGGIVVEFSSYNEFFHNNIVNKGKQIDVQGEVVNTWDDGYPSGGNYWSDYIGTDLYSGSYQNETGFDWTGDSPYIIDENNQDNYPLMNPYVPETEEVRIAYRKLLGKYNELKSDFNSLNSTYHDLLADYDNLQVAHDSLNSTYNNLVSDYNNLQSSYDQLNSSYTTLQDSYDELQLDQEATINELSTIRNLMYIFIATTIILIATTVYFAKRKPKMRK